MTEDDTSVLFEHFDRIDTRLAELEREDLQRSFIDEFGEDEKQVDPRFYTKTLLRLLEKWDREIPKDQEETNKRTAQELWTTLVEFERELEMQREDLDRQLAHVRFVEQRRGQHLKEKFLMRFEAFESAVNEGKIVFQRNVDRAEMQLEDLHSEIHRDLTS